MKLETLQDGDQPFDISVHIGNNNAPVVLFAAGAGGQPARYITLLDTLVNSGHTIIAPHFERLASPNPTENELILRARQLSLALDIFSDYSSKVVGVGHSIGATSLIALAGAKMWLKPNRQIDIAPDTRLRRLALLAPATGFFQTPSSLDAVVIPVLIWVGSEDNITPPQQSKWLAQTMPNPKVTDLHITKGAGHFSFMDTGPPNAIEPLDNKSDFIQEYSKAVVEFLAI